MKKWEISTFFLSLVNASILIDNAGRHLGPLTLPSLSLITKLCSVGLIFSLIKFFTTQPKEFLVYFDGVILSVTLSVIISLAVIRL